MSQACQRPAAIPAQKENEENAEADAASGEERSWHCFWVASRVGSKQSSLLAAIILALGCNH